MAEASIPVDLLNPGQVFACVGFLEAADVLLGDAEGGFDWSSSAGVRFVLRAARDVNPFEEVLRFLAAAHVTSVAPARSTNETEAWGVRTVRLPEGAPFPFPDPDSPATLPAALSPAGSPAGPRLILDHWGDDAGRDAVKFWGGGGGYPGAALARDALDLVRAVAVSAASDPFSVSAPQSSSFRFDWRRDYIPIDSGFSLNRHERIVTVGFPLVEVLAALGLGSARPERVKPLEYRYGVVGREAAADAPATFDPCLLRAALGGAALPFPLRRFRMFLGWPAKEGQARAITTVTEERLA